MKKILLVEDDALIARIYSQKLSLAGFEVVVATDGLEAMKLLPQVKADLVILDILMPKLSGIDVLQFIRNDAQLKTTKVIVFSNAFLDSIADRVTALGVSDMLMKSAVTPKQVVESIHTALGNTRTVPESDAAVLREESKGRETATDFSRRIRRDFFNQIPTITRTFKQAAEDFLAAVGSPECPKKLEVFSRKIGFLTHMTGLAGCHRIAQLSSAFEALLFEFQEKPANMNESSLQTVRATVDLLVEGLKRADQADEQCLSPTTILIVDDDVVSNRALVFALGRYRLQPVSVVDPFTALEKLKQNRFDIVLLDINLPGMDGIRMCEQMRQQLPLHKDTPVIFFTSYMEFEPRARTILRSGDDLIAKPILPIELTVRIIAHSLKHRLMRSAIAAPAAAPNHS
jgi:CheY-like chemotaxis protein